MAMDCQKPWGYRWRSSKSFILSIVVLALFAETFLYGFIVPILGYMLEVRLHVDPSQTQSLTSSLLAIHGFMTLVAAPIIAHFADKTPNRRTPLLIALAACAVGTILVACSPSVWGLFVGRILQGIAGSATWIVGFATMVDNVGMDNIGKTMGLSMSFVMAGIIFGPVIAGSLLELVGYWATWSVPLIVILLDIVARLLMIEGRNQSDGEHDPPQNHQTDTPTNEETALLQSSENSNEVAGTNGPPKAATEEPVSPLNFYLTALSDTRVVVGMSSVICASSVVAGFNATLPLHLSRIFNWGSLPVGMMFLAMQIPSMILGAPVGWLRDRVGLKHPTAIGWALQAPLLWLMGVPGDSHFPWAGADNNGQAIFVSAITGVGIVYTLIRGAGVVQMTIAVNEMQAKNPKIFGEHGGNSRISSMTEVAFSLGLVIGPILAGSLTELVGYYYMNFVFCILSLILAFATFSVFDGKRTFEPSDEV
ncbi:MFS transporter [Trichophyton mentagrophytes]|uniref:Major facilitator superfamily (MFS) profile domain-containing protein n=1 Tax=Trichophyton interdigitale (strain MR816) TaxID=1215338 RepID=A0A059J5T6_TRIIM|nr:hypothetical protein H101_07585 [Trichophyton interdigitale H6]KDB23180.1 hypothetical protein H109_04923 [Trichophyton interdigitale MR816]GBF66656.1 MFS transporter [Trichophyton mentagrophytes]